MSNPQWPGTPVNRQPAPQPQPAPQTPPPGQLPYSPAKVQQQAKTQQDMENANTRVVIDQQQNNRQQEDHDVKMRTVQANSGVDTQSSQDQAAGHALNLTRQLQTLDQIDADNQKPGFLESAIGMVTDDPNIMSVVRGGRDGQRQIAAAAQGSALESIIWLSTGAAVTDPQGRRYMNEITPFYGDSPETLRWKRDRLMGRIAEAKVRAGPANVKVQEALDMLGQRSEQLYAPERWAKTPETSEVSDSKFKKTYDQTNAKSPYYDDQGRPLMSVSDILAGAEPEKVRDEDYQTMDYPWQANAMHAQWVKENPNATTEDYVAFRKTLDKMYLGEENIGGGYEKDYTDPEIYAQAQNFLDWNRANPNSDIPPLHWRKKLSSFERARNWLNSKDPGGFANTTANAMTVGAVDLLTDDQSLANIRRRRDKNPGTTMAAEMLGSVLPVSRGAKAISTLGKAWLKKEISPARAMALANVGYGATRGIEEAPDGKAMQGALIGGLAALPGSVVGTKIAGGSRARVPSKLQAQIDQLGDVEDMTLMQATGRGRVEEGLQGLPKVREAREASIAGMNRGNVNRVLKPLGEKLPDDVETGFEANAHMAKVLNNEYNKLTPRIGGTLDSSYNNAFTAIRQKILNSGDPLKVDLWRQLQAVQSLFKGGKFNGNLFRDADQKLRDLANDWMQVEAGPGVVSPSTYHEMARVALKLKDNLRAQISRSHPQIAARLKTLDRAWAHKTRIENATNRSTTGIYSPKQYLTTLKMLDASKGRGRYAQGKAFDQQWARAADEVLGSAPPAEHANLMQSAMAYWAMARHPFKVGGPALALGALNYAPGVKQLAKVLATTKRPDYWMKALPPAYAQGGRKSIENRNK